MYSWQELALMYKRLLKDSPDRIWRIFEENDPNKFREYISQLESLLYSIDSETLYIESFESAIDSKKLPDIKEKLVIEENESNKNTKFGKYVKKEYILSDKDKDIISDFCPKYDDIYSIIEKSSVFCVINWLKERGYTVDFETAMSEKSNTIQAIKGNNIFQVKVCFSWMEWRGLSEINGKPIDVEMQHSYMINLNEKPRDIYVFVNYIKNENKYIVYAFLKGSFVQKMFVEPIIPRFKGKKACILQKSLYNKDVFPCSIDELLNKEV